MILRIFCFTLVLASNHLVQCITWKDSALITPECLAQLWPEVFHCNKVISGRGATLLENIEDMEIACCCVWVQQDCITQIGKGNCSDDNWQSYQGVVIERQLRLEANDCKLHKYVPKTYGNCMRRDDSTTQADNSCNAVYVNRIFFLSVLLLLSSLMSKVNV